MGAKANAVYAATKGAVIAFTKSIAMENARYGITVNAVAPGPIETPLLRPHAAEGHRHRHGQHAAAPSGSTRGGGGRRGLPGLGGGVVHHRRDAGRLRRHVPGRLEEIEHEHRGPCWDQLIEPDRVHSSLYTDPAIYEAELERIWYRTWVYVGHESEVPEPNDYVLKSIGPQPVIMTRDRQGEIHLLLNRCSPPGQPRLRRAAGQLQRLPLPLPRLDVRQHRCAARLPVQLRLRRPGAQVGAGPGPRAPDGELPGVRLRLLRRGRADPGRAPRRRRRRDRPARAALPRGARRAARPAG